MRQVMIVLSLFLLSDDTVCDALRKKADDLVVTIETDDLNVLDGMIEGKGFVYVKSIGEQLKNYNKKIFKKEMRFYGRAYFYKPVHFHKRIHFKKDIVVDGQLSISSLTVDTIIGIKSSLGGSNTLHIGDMQTITYIPGINGAPITGTAVLVSSTGQLGTFLSSRQFKTNIQPLACATGNIYFLEPVQFTYKSDEMNTMQYGLIAEEVDLLFPHLVMKDSDGRPYTVRYEILPVVLLKEIQKHQMVIDKLSDTVLSLSTKLEQVMKWVDTIDQKNI